MTFTMPFCDIQTLNHADSMSETIGKICFVYYGFCFVLKPFPYAPFPVDLVKGPQLFPMFWEAVHWLECIGFSVISCICDGTTSNRRLHHLLTNSQSDKHKVLNKYSEEKQYNYLICDPPHLIKTVRNCFASRLLCVSLYCIIDYMCLN